MILTKNDIINEANNGKIVIKPLNLDNICANSVDVTLNKTLLIYKNKTLDMISNEQTEEIVIPNDGLVLQPGELYIGMTNEVAGSEHYIPMYEGRSSLARLGISSHISAGFGDIGYVNKWTLEITVVKPVRIYPNIRIGQVYFVEPSTVDHKELYLGKYGNIDMDKPVASKGYIDFTK